MLLANNGVFSAKSAILYQTSTHIIPNLFGNQQLDLMAKSSLVVILKILSHDLPQIGHKYKRDKKLIILTTT